MAEEEEATAEEEEATAEVVNVAVKMKKKRISKDFIMSLPIESMRVVFFYGEGYGDNCNIYRHPQKHEGYKNYVNNY